VAARPGPAAGDVAVLPFVEILESGRRLADPVPVARSFIDAKTGTCRNKVLSDQVTAQIRLTREGLGCPRKRGTFTSFDRKGLIPFACDHWLPKPNERDKAKALNYVQAAFIRTCPRAAARFSAAIRQRPAFTSSTAFAVSSCMVRRI
jgi:hypothetical protein